MTDTATATSAPAAPGKKVRKAPEGAVRAAGTKKQAAMVTADPLTLLLDDLKWPASEFAKQIGMNTSTVARWITTGTMPVYVGVLVDGVRARHTQEVMLFVYGSARDIGTIQSVANSLGLKYSEVE